jgi:hypothetical protein
MSLWDASGWVKSKYTWLKVETPKIFLIVLLTVLFTFLISGAFSLFPFPSPAMSIAEPRNGERILVPAPFGPNNERNGTTFEITISVFPGWERTLLYDWEFSQRIIKYLNWDPKIWLMARAINSNKWEPFEKVENYADGSLSAPIILYSPETWDIELLSLNARDDEYVSNYVAAINAIGGYPIPMDRPQSAHSITEIRLTTYQNN